MNRRGFTAGALIGAILMGIAFVAAAAALQPEGGQGLAEGERAFTAENLAFVTKDPAARPVEGRLMVRVDDEWVDVRFQPLTMPAD